MNRYNMSKQQTRLAHVLITLFIVASMVCIIAKVELWPFSYYPLYTRRYTQTYRDNILYGITKDGEQIRLSKKKYWYPLNEIHIARVILRLKELNDADEASGNGLKPSRRLDQETTLAQFLNQHYHTRSHRRHHDGPMLRGLRLYRVTWTIQPRAVNRDQPDHRHLIAGINFNSGKMHFR